MRYVYEKNKDGVVSKLSLIKNSCCNSKENVSGNYPKEIKKEIKVITDKGIALINLACTARVCGLTTVAKSRNEVVRWKGKGNTGLPKVRWDDIKKKLNLIADNLQDESSTPKIKLEINYALDEIENTDDRNTIYISTWLSKRFAIECHSNKAMENKINYFCFHHSLILCQFLLLLSQ